MGFCAGPTIILGIAHQTDLDRITFNVPCYDPKVFVVLDNAGEKAILPNTTLIQLTIEILRIDLIGQADTTSKRVFFFRDNQQMNMVLHQAISPNV